MQVDLLNEHKLGGGFKYFLFSPVFGEGSRSPEGTLVCPNRANSARVLDFLGVVLYRGFRARSPTWHRRLRKRRSTARELVRRQGVGAVSWKRALVVARALHRLQEHHSRPQYKVSSVVATAYRFLYGQQQMTWGKGRWEGWGKSKSPPQNAKKDKEKKDKDQQQGKFPAYDAGGKGGGSSSSSASASAGLATPEVVELLKTLVAKDQSIAPKVEGLIPDPLKEEIKTKQRAINQIRKLQQKVERKEAAIAKKESQMTSFLEEVKQHVLQEKTRHKAEMEILRRELDEAKEALQSAKDGREVKEEEMNAEIETIFLDEDEVAKENQELKQKLMILEYEKNQQQEHMQEQMYQMQSQMETFMRQYSDNVKVAAANAMAPNMVEDPSKPYVGITLQVH